MNGKPDPLKEKLNFQKNLMRVAEAVELILAAIILLYCIISTVGNVFTIKLDQLFRNASYLQQMSNVCLIIIGIELIIMITSYFIDSVVDVMLLAVARQKFNPYIPHWPCRGRTSVQAEWEDKVVAVLEAREMINTTAVNPILLDIGI